MSGREARSFGSPDFSEQAVSSADDDISWRTDFLQILQQHCSRFSLN
jgi:hypothetical protein